MPISTYQANFPEPSYSSWASSLIVATFFGLLVIALLGGASSLASTFNGIIGQRLGLLRATLVFLVTGVSCAFIFIVLFESHVFHETISLNLSVHHFLPGLVNALLIATLIRTVSILGAMQTTASVFSGKVISSVILDHFGAFGLPIIPATQSRLFGAVLLMGAVALLLVDYRRLGQAIRPLALPALFAALGMGALDTISMAINTQLAQTTGPFTAIMLFLLPGMILLSILKKRITCNVSEFHPFYVLPGILNVVGLAITLLIIPVVGLQLANATRFAAAIIAGSLLDHFGIFSVIRISLTRTRLVAIVLLMLGISSTAILS